VKPAQFEYFAPTTVDETVATLAEQTKAEGLTAPVITVIGRPETPVRPDRRLLLQKVLIGLAAGLILGLFVVLARHFFPSGEGEASDEVAEFAALKRAAVDDLTHPWRPVRRALRLRGRAVY